MKKFFAIAIITASLAACNNSGESKSSSDTTTTVSPDTSANKMMTDTSKPKMDTSAKK